MTSMIKHMRRLQDQVYEDFEINYMRTLNFSFQRNEASALKHIAPTYFHVYSIHVILHAHVNGCAPMLGFTRIILSFLETSELLGSCHRFRIA
jgi:hypothetical protein